MPATRPPGPAPRHNLPAERTSLIGRERERVDLARALAAARLVTLTGVGGCGKTRLALAAAADLVAAYPDGAWLVELAPIAEPALLPSAVAAALGLRDPAEADLLAFLGARATLLVLDNCEHLVDACAAFAARALAAAPGLRILATSREPLQIAGEQQWRVAPLAAPDPAHLPPPDELDRIPAVRLFVERARAVAPAFRLTAENAAAVAGICARLDGLPLALELAAARVRVLAPAQILARLDDALALLVGSSRAAPTRQQTLRATLDWSYALLDEPERAAFARLAVFAGGGDLAAAEAVCAEVRNGKREVRNGPPGAGFALLPSRFPLLDTLTRLVDKSLVQVEAGGEAARYRLLEPVRQYALGHLAAGEEAAARARHAAHYLALAEAAAPRLTGPEQAVWLARLDGERDNLRAALGWALAGDPATALRLGAALWRFWHLRDYLAEGRRQLAAILRLAMPAEDAAHRRALFGAGLLAIWQADYADARRHLNALLPLARAAGDDECIANTLHQLGQIASREGRLDEADRLFREGLALYRAGGERRDVAISLIGLGDVARVRGDYAGARAHYEESLVLLRQEGAWDQVTHALCQLGRVQVARGDLASAQACFDESLALSRATGLERDVAIALYHLGSLARARGDTGQALAHYREGLERWQRAGALRLIAGGLEGVGAVLADRGRPAEAARLFGAAAGLREATGARLLPPELEPHERAVAAARAALGENAFAQERAAGAALPRAAAIAFALESAAAAEAAPAAPPPPARLAPDALTRREREVALLLARGYSDRQVADALSIGAGTAGVHVHHILEKLGLRSRHQVAAWAVAQGLLAPPPD